MVKTSEIKKKKEEKFLKPTVAKIIITALITVLIYSVRILYGRILMLNNPTGELKISWGLKMLHGTTAILSYLPQAITSPFWTFIKQDYTTCTIAGNCPLYINLFLFSSIALVLIVQNYILSCLVILLASKLKRK